MKVLITARLPQQVLSLIQREHQVESNSEDRPMPRADLLANIGDKDGLLCTVTDRIDDELFEHAPNLRMVANFAVGYDNIDLVGATARGIWVSNTPDVLTDATADLTFALILGVARRVVEGDKRTREGKFKYFAPLLFLGSDVSGKVLGIIGLGEIGKAVARRARGFAMRVLYHSRRRIPESEERELKASYVSMERLLSESDFVSLHVPLNTETRHLIGRKQLELMKPTAFLINASRGPVVDEQALVKALQLRQIAGAGLDVYENEPTLTPGLTELENVILMPHSGSATLETRIKMASLAARNLLAGLRGELPPNCLNCA
jgi:glyoxylate reductase